MANVKDKTATRTLQVQFQNARDVWQVTTVSVPAGLSADEVVERVREFVPAAPDVPVEDWLVATDSREKIAVRQIPPAVTKAEVEEATQVVRYEMEAATTRAYARELGIPDGYHWGDRRRLYRHVKIVVPVRYSDGREGTLSVPNLIDVTYKVGQRERFSMRIGPLTIGGVEHLWPGAAEQLKPAELEERFGDQVTGVPEIQWPYRVDVDTPSPEAQLAARKKAKAREKFVLSKEEALPAHELRRMGVSEDEIQAIWGDRS